MSAPPAILALDSAGAACSAALWYGGAVKAHRLALMDRGQSERLVPMVAEVMAEAKMSFDALDAIAVTLGPGGFTGVRIGLATARGLALAAGKPILGVSNFEALAAAVPEPERRGRRLAVLLDAKRAEVFVQLFDQDLSPLRRPESITPDTLDGFLGSGPLVLAGAGLDQCLPTLRASGRRDLLVSTAPVHADAVQVAGLAVAMTIPGPDAPSPQPIYLRAPDTTLPRNRA